MAKGKKKTRDTWKLHPGHQRPLAKSGGPLPGDVRVQYREFQRGPARFARVGNLDWSRVAEWRFA